MTVDDKIRRRSIQGQLNATVERCSDPSFKLVT